MGVLKNTNKKVLLFLKLPLMTTSQAIPPTSPLVTSLPRDFTSTKSLAPFILSSAQAQALTKNGAGADSDGVPIDRLVLRLSVDRLAVFRLRYLQIRHPARQ